MVNLPSGCILADIQTLVPYAKNPKNHDDKDIDLIVRAKPIKDFIGYYITDNGTVYSRNYKQTGRIIRLKSKLSVGYPMVCLCKKGKMFYKRIHRLVAETFIPNLENKPEVNHKNGIKTDNRVQNLEWCSQSENMLHSYKVLHQKKGMLGKTGKKHCASKKILQIQDYKIVKEFFGSGDAERKTGICSRNIRAVCNNKRNTAGGYQWKWK